MLAAIFELDSRAGDQVLDGARNEHLARLGEGGDARPDVNGDAARFAVNELALAAVQPSAYVLTSQKSECQIKCLWGR